MPLLDELRARLGEGAVLSGTALAGRSAGFWHPEPLRAAALVRPASTDEVALALALCHAAGQPVVPIGGLTNLVGSAACGEGEIALSLERMNRVEAVDVAGRALTVEAGLTLQRAQEVAAAHGLLLALDFGARGSCTIGGVIATNAGGNNVLRWGMARAQVLGLEVVLADGRVLGALTPYRKANAGYDLKQCFIGSEGTLGVVTRAVLALQERPAGGATALLACERFTDVTALLRLVDRALAGTLSAFELMWGDFYALNAAAGGGAAPLPAEHGYYVLVEACGESIAADEARLQAALEAAFEAGHVSDAVLAKSGPERERLWAIREATEPEQHAYRATQTFDVSLALDAMEAYVGRVRAGLARAAPAAVLHVFGHLGDGNLHLLVGHPEAVAQATTAAVEALVYEPLVACGGCISAEHGIGLEKKRWLPRSRSADELALMRGLKRTFDPAGILNPGKVFDPDPQG
ncbi:FAD/FMN-containing dehydrogenase [Plasticicumulans lactativorans]|uniref:FAD/FMN-containing dehydrogenase n=1 Tax=Plasticicumulans lactativorans TaxID=1133106 RepID=A0A4R2L774_9GAMM|nr:FAD-binding oxidoreductase [Plasticicumulans lactativorans]TCO83329.1 FAD/FMN-containing dehydrogenase [Plasticicumulans lactativorans]